MRLEYAIRSRDEACTLAIDVTLRDPVMASWQCVSSGVHALKVKLTDSALVTRAFQVGYLRNRSPEHVVFSRSCLLARTQPIYLRPVEPSPTNS